MENMKSYYQMTVLEKWTEDLYKRLNLHQPSQISISYIAERLNIWVHYLDVRSKSIEASAGMYSLFIDNRLPANLQRLEFLHELCHLLRHGSDNQTLMPEHFTRAQEDESERFILYAATPCSMISRMTLPEQRKMPSPILQQNSKYLPSWPYSGLIRSKDVCSKGNYWP